MEEENTSADRPTLKSLDQRVADLEAQVTSSDPTTLGAALQRIAELEDQLAPVPPAPPRTHCITCGRPVNAELIRELVDNGQLRKPHATESRESWVHDDGRCADCVDAGRVVPAPPAEVREA